MVIITSIASSFDLKEDASRDMASGGFDRDWRNLIEYASTNTIPSRKMLSILRKARLKDKEMRVLML